MVSLNSDARSTADVLENFVHVSAPDLAHFIALLSKPFENHQAGNISLMIIDSFSTIISTAFPRPLDAVSTTRKSGGKISSIEL